MNAKSKLKQSLQQLGDRLQHSDDVQLLMVTDIALSVFGEVDLDSMNADARDESLDAMQRAVDELLKLAS